MPDGLPMMPWYEGDFMRSTRGWSVTAKGVYRELLCAQWDAGVLPEDGAELRILIGATVPEWQAGWKKCISKFPKVNGGRQNARLEEHRCKALMLAESRSKGARKTNAQRYGERDAGRPAERDADRGAGRPAQRSHPEPQPQPQPDPDLTQSSASVTSPRAGVGNGSEGDKSREAELQVIREANPRCHPETVLGKWLEYLTREAFHPRNPLRHLAAFAKRERFSEEQWNARKAEEREISGSAAPLIGDLAMKLAT